MTYSERQRQHQRQHQQQLRNGRQVEPLHRVIVELCRRSRSVEYVKLTPAGSIVVKSRPR